MPLPPSMKVLIVEDNKGHARLIDIFLREAGFDNERIILFSGTEAVDFLFDGGEYDGHSCPESLLLLLDLGLPGIDGHDILERLKKTETTAHFPVVVVTSNIDPDEEDRCRALGADAFLVKPPSPVAFQETFKALGLLVDDMEPAANPA